MNDHVTDPPSTAETELTNKDPWSNLMALARLIEFDEVTGTLTIRNGEARLVLRRDGTIRIDGVRLVQTAERTIVLHAATIDLN